MCFGIGESNEGTATERRDEDEKRIKEIITDIVEDSDVQFEKPIRIGKFNENPTASKIRPIKLVFQNFEEKKMILKAARERVNTSKEEKYKPIFFQSDLTQKQREEAFLKRQQRRNSRTTEDQRRATDAQRQVTDNRRELNTARDPSQREIGNPPGRPRADTFRD